MRRKRSLVGSMRARLFAGSNGETDMVDYPGRFAWYELITTDMAAAKAFYADVVGWGAQDASTPGLAYTLFTAGRAPVGGLMDLPEEGRKMGATPRWMGYVGVNDVDAAADRIKRLGGAVYVPPTDSNIGRISVVCRPANGNLALVEGLKPGQPQPAELDAPGRVGWHELLAADWEKAFAFYGELFGWQKEDAETGPADTYQLFSAGGQTIGGMRHQDIRWSRSRSGFITSMSATSTRATERVKTGGGQIFEGPHEIAGRQLDRPMHGPSGCRVRAAGKRSQEVIGRDPASEVGWSTEWGGFSSKGRLVTKPRG